VVCYPHIPEQWWVTFLFFLLFTKYVWCAIHFQTSRHEKDGTWSELTWFETNVSNFHLKTAWSIVNLISRQSLQILSMYQWNLLIEIKLIQILLFSWRNVSVKIVLGIVMLLQNFMFSDFNVLLKYIIHYNKFVLVLNIAEILLTWI
jgi:hypothetical protein